MFDVAEMEENDKKDIKKKKSADSYGQVEGDPDSLDIADDIDL